LTRFQSWLEIGATSLSGKHTITLTDGIRQQGWGTLPPDQFIYLYADLIKLHPKISTELLTTIQSNCQTMNIAMPKDFLEQFLELISESFRAAAKSIKDFVPILSDFILGSVTKKCSDALQPVRLISSHYRMTNKEPPNRYSFYVTEIFQSLKEFLAEKDIKLPQSLITTWTTEIITKVTESYYVQANEMVTQVFAQSKIIRKMSSKDVTSQNSDNDKIALQLYLDVEEYGKQISNFSIDKNTFEPYQNLKNIAFIKTIPNVPTLPVHNNTVSFTASQF